LIEKVSHILDFFNKEKIVRIILMLFDNIKTHDGCLEQMADINITGVSFCYNILAPYQALK